ncbi:MAG: hypothetical protein O2930_09050 [Acidobacteria bacterium]|nr:hypothetical protein [Acidobacteriota bacterium]
MRLIPLVSAAFILLVPGPSSAQEWIEYSSPVDLFTVNFPAEPDVRETAYQTEYGVTVQGRVYSIENGSSRYSVTVVDYANVEAIHAARLDGCEGPSRTTANLCANPWVAELEGALDYASWNILRRDGEVTDYAYYRAERVEGRRIQLTNVDRSRTFAAIHMHENRLYIFEGTVPPGAPPPGLFQQSLGFIDDRGIRVRYETTYTNMHPPPPRVQYGEQANVVPDLAGLDMGMRRTFTEGPFARQTWEVDGSGDPMLVEAGAPGDSQGAP